MDKERVKKLVRELIIEIGEDPTREGLKDTPRRIADAYTEIFSGYDSDSELSVQFSEDSEMVVAKNIQFYSMCEHHMIPFFGKAHVGYIPNGKVIGLSKIPRIIDMFSRRLQVQERLTHQVADTIKDSLDPIGVAVVMEGRHLCMQMRGVAKQNSFATTSAMLGQFRKSRETRAEFLSFIGK